MDNTNIIKVDLDIKIKQSAINFLIERLKFLSDTNILPFKYVTDIVLIKKKTHSVKIYLSKSLQHETLILFQSILGDDYKRTAITFRDYKLGIRNYNRIFDTKRYLSGDYKIAKKNSVFEIIKSRITNQIEL